MTSHLPVHLGQPTEYNHFTKPTFNFKIKLKYMISPSLIKLPVYCQTDFNCIIVFGHIHFCHVHYLFHCCGGGVFEITYVNNKYDH